MRVLNSYNEVGKEVWYWIFLIVGFLIFDKSSIFSFGIVSGFFFYGEDDFGFIVILGKDFLCACFGYVILRIFWEVIFYYCWLEGVSRIGFGGYGCIGVLFFSVCWLEKVRGVFVFVFVRGCFFFLRESWGRFVIFVLRFL